MHAIFHENPSQPRNVASAEDKVMISAAESRLASPILVRRATIPIPCVQMPHGWRHHNAVDPAKKPRRTTCPCRLQPPKQTHAPLSAVTHGLQDSLQLSASNSVIAEDSLMLRCSSRQRYPSSTPASFFGSNFFARSAAISHMACHTHYQSRTSKHS